MSDSASCSQECAIGATVPGSGARPAIVALTGTDLYGDLRTSAAAQRSLALATRLILLQPRGITELAGRFRPKARVIYQSVTPIATPAPRQRVFEICVSGHLRPVKDPFRAAVAARYLSPSSRILVTHIGAALSAAMAKRADDEMRRNSRYRWLGEVPHGKARQILARSCALVLSSKMEGGANVLAEAVTAGVPALASRISGSIGMLGDDYAAYFPVGDTDQLASLMHRCEVDERYYRRLQSQCAERAPLFRPERESEAWRSVLAEVMG